VSNKNAKDFLVLVYVVLAPRTGGVVEQALDLVQDLCDKPAIICFVQRLVLNDEAAVAVSKQALIRNLSVQRMCL